MLSLAIRVISSQMDLYEILNKSRPFESRTGWMYIPTKEDLPWKMTYSLLGEMGNYICCEHLLGNLEPGVCWSL